MSTTPDLLPAEAPAPRLCHLVKIASFDGYGFNLHAEKSRPGQFIGKVDSGSPAELAGMLEGDRIVEVNGVNIASESHKQVVERIRAVPDETRLLVVDSAADAWYREHKLVPRSTQDNVCYIRTPTGDDEQSPPNGHAHDQASEENAPLPPAQDKPDEPTAEAPTSAAANDGEQGADELPADAPQPRLCHMTKWSDFEGYGFNLHAEKDRRGQYVGKIDAGSPAEHAGLREGDRIVEVNGANVQQEAHRDIVERIRAVPDETRLLVLTADGEQWYRDRGIEVRGDRPNVLRLRNPPLNPATGLQGGEDGASSGGGDEDRHSRKDDDEEAAQLAPTPILRRQSGLEGKEDADEDESRSPEPEAAPAKMEEPTREDKAPDAAPDVAESHVTEAPRVEESPVASKPVAVPPPSEPASATSNGSLNLNMSASEMRQLLAQRKKHDPKKIQMDLKKKYELIEQM